jgi:ectoine hydroxylase-related dioxygenase (phytanoyl-CoA dioxygenase family)
VLPERFSDLRDGGADPLTLEVAERGCAIIRGALPADLIARVSAACDERFAATPFCVGDFHGTRTKRFHRLLLRAPGSAELVMHGAVLSAVRRLLGRWCDFPEVSLTQGVEIHAGAPAQIPHADQAMWPAVPKYQMELCVNVFWPFVDFTPENGATRVWPGTHAAARDPSAPLGEPEVCAAQPGDAILVLGSTVHAAGANETSLPRRGAIVSYCLGWLKAYENQSLAYPPDFVRTLPTELAAMLGYRWHRPNLGTYDGQCPSVLLDGDVPEHLATVDALSVEHQALVAAHARRESARRAH